MKYCYSYGARVASVLVIATTTSSWATGQEASAAAPPPSDMPSVMAAPAAEPMSPSGSLSGEPTIDTATTQSSLPNTPLLVTGLVVFGGSYGASVIVGGLSDRDADKNLYYPLVGPWMDLNQRDCDTNYCGHETRDNVLLISDGIVQGLGALSLLLSVMIPEETTKHWYLIGNQDILVVPRVDNATLGLGAVGRF